MKDTPQIYNAYILSRGDYNSTKVNVNTDQGSYWVPGRPLSYQNSFFVNFLIKLKYCWMIFRDKADLLIWPGQAGHNTDNMIEYKDHRPGIKFTWDPKYRVGYFNIMEKESTFTCLSSEGTCVIDRDIHGNIVGIEILEHGNG